MIHICLQNETHRGTRTQPSREALKSHFLIFDIYYFRFVQIASPGTRNESRNLHVNLMDPVAGRDLRAMDNWTTSDTSLKSIAKRFPEKGGSRGDWEEEART